MEKEYIFQNIYSIFKYKYNIDINDLLFTKFNIKLKDIINYELLNSQSYINLNSFFESFINLDYFFNNNKELINLLKDNGIFFNWIYFSAHHNLTIKYISDNKDLPWDYIAFSNSKNISINDILSNLYFNWDWVNLTTNDNISADDIINNSELPWDIDMLWIRDDIPISFLLNKSQNNNLYLLKYHYYKITLNDILNNPTYEWDWYHISKFSKITSEDVKNNLNLPWDYTYLSYNNNVSLVDLINDPIIKIKLEECDEINSLDIDYQYILDNPNISWNYKSLAGSNKITLEMILENKIFFDNIKYGNSSIEYNPNITYKDILETKDKIKWDWKKLSNNSNIDINDIYHYFSNYEFTFDIIKDRIDWVILSRKPNTTVEDIIKHPELPWKNYIQRNNPNIRLYHIIKYPDFPWDWKQLWDNNYLLNRDNDPGYIEYSKKVTASNTIKFYWRICYYCPKYNICRKRLLNEFKNL